MWRWIKLFELTNDKLSQAGSIGGDLPVSAFCSGLKDICLSHTDVGK